MKLIKRKTTTLNRDELSSDLLHPEQLRIQFENRAHPFDIGCIAYTKREFGGKKSPKNFSDPILVDIDSLSKNRRVFLIQLCDHLCLNKSRDTSAVSLFTKYRNILDWCDKNDHSYILNNPNDSKRAYFNYTFYLLNNIKNFNLKVNMTKWHASEMQKHFRQLLKIAYPKEHKEITSDIQTIFKGQRPTVDIDPKKIHYVKDVFLSLFTTFSKFCLENGDFPVKIKTPDFQSYIFPSSYGFIRSPFSSEKLSSTFCFDKGRLRTEAEYFKITNQERSEVTRRSDLKKSIKTFDKHNNNEYSTYKLGLAAMALRSFYILFKISTAATAQVMSDLKYDREIDSHDSIKKGLKAVKFRANGKWITLQIGSRTSLQLKQYLKIRKWILRGEDFPYLFFVLRNNSFDNPKKAPIDYLKYVFKTAKGSYLPKDFATLTQSEIRTFKTNDYYKNGKSPDVTSTALGHTKETSLNIYARGTKETQEEEFSKYWASFKESLITNPTSPKKTKLTATGKCKNNLTNPTPIYDSPPIEPDCTKVFGCLYCKHYAIHSDSEDIKKLTCLIYVLELINDKSNHFEFSTNLFSELSLRAKFYLNEISKMNKKNALLVSEIRKQVFEYGELTPFWEFRLQRYEEMGVIL